jgi:hypothetical protein
MLNKKKLSSEEHGQFDAISRDSIQHMVSIVRGCVPCKAKADLFYSIY